MTNGRHIRVIRSDILAGYRDFKSSLIAKAQLITSDARVGILPRVIILIDNICSDLSRSPFADPLALPFIELIVFTVVRVDQNPGESYSLVVLRKFIPLIRSRFLVFFDETPLEVGFLVFHESASRHFRINILGEYPDLIRRWSPEKGKFLGRIISSFQVREVPLEQGCAILLANAEDEHLEIAARVVSDIMVRHMRLRRKGIFEEVPLVDPHQFVRVYLENPASRFASWVVDRLLFRLPVGLPHKKKRGFTGCFAAHDSEVFRISFSVHGYGAETFGDLSKHCRKNDSKTHPDRVSRPSSAKRNRVGYVGSSRISSISIPA